MIGYERLLVMASASAREFGSSVIGDEHVVLGVLRGSGPACEAMKAAGASEDSLRRVLPAGDGEDVALGTSPTPAAQMLLAASVGHALAHGRDEATEADVLVVALWGDATSRARWALEQAGVDPARLVDALRSAGVAVPDLPLPDAVEVTMGPDVIVPVTHLDDVMAVLPPALAQEGLVFGFGMLDEERAALSAEAAADLPARVAALLPHGTFEVRPPAAPISREDRRRRRPRQG